MAEPRTLTQQDLNRALLARQLLLEPGRMSIPKALERIGGIQAQYAPSMYVGLWSRLATFERDDLTRALERRTVVQGTLMRATIHLVSKGDYWPFAVAIRRRQREWFLLSRQHRIDVKALQAAVRRARPKFRGGPLTQKELDAVVGGDPSLRNGVGIFLDLVRVPPSGTWERRRADIYALASEWIGPAAVSEQEGVDHVVRRYLQGFGPAAVADIAKWAALKPTTVKQALGRLTLREHRDEQGKTLYDLPRAPLPDPETPAPLRFLPVWDATLLVHARRTGILPEEYRPRIFNVKTPHSVNTFLVDGRVAGTWRYEQGRVQTQPFRKLTAAERKELKDGAERLAELHA